MFILWSNASKAASALLQHLSRCLHESLAQKTKGCYGQGCEAGGCCAGAAEKGEAMNAYLSCIVCGEFMAGIFSYSIRDTCDKCGGKSECEYDLDMQPRERKHKRFVTNMDENV